MNVKDLDVLIDESFKRQMRILETKGKDYTQGQEDRLINFRRIADELEIPVRQVWWVYFKKHIDAILTWVKKGEVESEGLEGRFDDAHNYLYLGEALYKEYREGGLK